MGLPDQHRPKVPKRAALIDATKPDALAYVDFPATHRIQLHSPKPLGHRDGEIKHQTEVVGIFPDKDAIARVVGAILLEQTHK